MTTLKFKCTLLSDVILNQKAASEGQNRTLDFIPGSCFLGIVADKIYNDQSGVKGVEALDLFHNGNVIFGDAHPVCEYYDEDDYENPKISNYRSLKIPATVHKPKMDKKNAYLFHFVPDLSSDYIKKLQLKQEKSGFFDFSFVGSNNVKTAKKVHTDNSMAIKSAYNRSQRRSEDKQMYGYESLNRGLKMYFEVIVNDDKYKQIIIDNLQGHNRVGRSRTAQYGLVNIQFLDKADKEYKEIESTNNLCKVKHKDGNTEVTDDCAVVYADGRLIFLDDNGLPTFNITADKLGLDGTIIWDRSQVRTFQYSPWNYHRQCFDADRCGFEKGSVFVVKTTRKSFESQYVGDYQHEGFGKVIYNPDFLLRAKTINGLYQYALDDNEKPQPQSEASEVRKQRIKVEINNLQSHNNQLLSYLAAQKEEELKEDNIFEKVSEFVIANKNKFSGEKFASQWGSIRSIAMKHPTFDELKEELFEHTIDKNGKKEPHAYLTHGVAKDKWKKGGRFDIFKKFFYGLSDYEGDFAQLVIINLAAQMAKQK